jgi:hypothetical protein
VATGLETVDCKNDNVDFGDSCSTVASSTFGVVTCTSATCVKSGCQAFDCGNITGSVRSTTFNSILTRMQGVYPFIQASNVRIIYRDLPALRFAGRAYDPNIFPAGGVVPEVEVRLTGMTFSFFLAGPLFGVDSLPMPDIRAMRIGEDMNGCDQPETGAPSCSPS